ncbi:hypothetical protein BpHYR1_045277 [Brachionus plicatilis]|uniref:Uncharacterized protein n=1 Tax=Brachionus plicatilis TaxID=10195 RepID=A0A3M7QTU0_BRAPC|nr:hypothetical protein BpHYR1_045277 [Brachionus plicatilis]
MTIYPTQMQKVNSINLMFHASKIFQELCGSKILIDSFAGIIDHASTSLNPGNVVGKAFNFPSSFEGGDHAI